MGYVWYLGYGSNLQKHRFLCYIKGGIPKYGKRCNDGCTDESLPIEDRAKIISYPLYFALPNGKTETSNWRSGGVAFIDPKEDKKIKTLCRMWKITEEQYQQVKKQEGPGWYNKEIYIDEIEGIPVFTITHDQVLTNILCPSEEYIKTIAEGLKESHNFTAEEIFKYLHEKTGIRGRRVEP